MIFRSVLLPLPLRPNIPKKSPFSTSKDMSFSTKNSSVLLSFGLNYCVTVALIESSLCRGKRNFFDTPLTLIAGLLFIPYTSSAKYGDRRRKYQAPKINTAVVIINGATSTNILSVTVAAVSAVAVIPKCRAS